MRCSTCEVLAYLAFNQTNQPTNTCLFESKITQVLLDYYCKTWFLFHQFPNNSWIFKKRFRHYVQFCAVSNKKLNGFKYGFLMEFWSLGEGMRSTKCHSHSSLDYTIDHRLAQDNII